MKRAKLLFAGLYVAATMGGIPAAQAHSVQQCQKEITWFTRLCKFGITLRLMGVCDTDKSIKWCTNKKQHDEKFHK